MLLLSDWTNEDPGEVMRTLMRGSDWYSIRKGTAQSVFGALKAGKLKDYWDREWSRYLASSETWWSRFSLVNPSVT